MPEKGRRPAPGRDLSEQQETTISLLERVREGDAGARDRLVHRYLPALRRWARGRLPRNLRDLQDTDDLVQVTLLRALDHVDEFVPRHQGAFFAYLRRILLNQIRDEIRRARRRPAAAGAPDPLPDPGPSPLEAAIGSETLARYEAALQRLPLRDQEAVMLRLELDLTHAQVAEALGYPSANAARMAVSRALVRLAGVMHGP